MILFIAIFCGPDCIRFVRIPCLVLAQSNALHPGSNTTFFRLGAISLVKSALPSSPLLLEVLLESDAPEAPPMPGGAVLALVLGGTPNRPAPLEFVKGREGGARESLEDDAEEFGMLVSEVGPLCEVEEEELAGVVGVAGTPKILFSDAILTPLPLPLAEVDCAEI